MARQSSIDHYTFLNELDEKSSFIQEDNHYQYEDVEMFEDYQDYENSFVEYEELESSWLSAENSSFFDIELEEKETLL
jgi:hypothetical protein